jgi:hypothetical protein
MVVFREEAPGLLETIDKGWTPITKQSLPRGCEEQVTEANLFCSLPIEES